jgi:hypothetical protein
MYRKKFTIYDFVLPPAAVDEASDATAEPATSMQYASKVFYR